MGWFILLTYLIIGFFVGIAWVRVESISNHEKFPSLYPEVDGKPRIDSAWAGLIAASVFFWPITGGIALSTYFSMRSRKLRREKGAGPVLSAVIRMTQTAPPKD